MVYKKLPFTFIILPLTYYYFGWVIFLTYLYSIRYVFSKTLINTHLICILIFSFFIITIGKMGLADGLYVYRFFFGWCFFYLFFSCGYTFDQKRLLIILSAFVIGEAVAINSFLSVNSLPNYPDPATFWLHYAAPGQYQRPFSFGGSPSVTSVILVALMANLNLRLKEHLLPVTAVFCCMSGSGYFILLLYIFYRFVRKVTTLVVILFILLFIYLTLNVPYKYSLEYLTFIVGFKFERITELQSFGAKEILFGSRFSDVGEYGGDFQLLSFMKLNGVFGFLVLAVVVWMNSNQKNRVSLFLMLLGSLHYGTVFYFPGQFIFGYFLALRDDQDANSPVALPPNVLKT